MNIEQLAQNTDLSFGARGLGAYLLTLPPGTPVTIKSVTAVNPDGRQTTASYMRELEKVGILVRTTMRGAQGRMTTICTVSREPHDPESAPASLPKPWSKNAARRGAEGDVVYVIGQPGSSVVKIGVTSSLGTRLRGIQTGSPVPLSVLWWHPAGHELESELHQRFAPIRLEGEWFDFGLEDPARAVQEAVRELRPADFRSEVTG